MLHLLAFRAPVQHPSVSVDKTKPSLHATNGVCDAHLKHGHSKITVRGHEWQSVPAVPGGLGGEYVITCYHVPCREVVLTMGV
jgi:hypothetical protein